MPKYRFMYDTGVSVVFPFENEEMAKAFVDASPDNLMFYYEAAEEFRSKHKYSEDCDCYLLISPDEKSS